MSKLLDAKKVYEKHNYIVYKVNKQGNYKYKIYQYGSLLFCTMNRKMYKRYIAHPDEYYKFIYDE